MQGHIAYPHLARNPIHLAAPVLVELAATAWDAGNEYFQPTSWQASNIQAGSGATNVIPNSLEVVFNFRFATVSTPEALQNQVRAILDKHGLDYELVWDPPSKPFLTPRGKLVCVLSEAIEEVTGTQAQVSTTGGTSDGRFITEICPQVVEFGPINASIHKLNECIDVADIECLCSIYRRTLEKLLLSR